ncbi:hypothetical protein DIPPA_19791 [Diplonema papillatum]|nr:hypothetical protein DIPPA_19791 [Diplonema papillatum]
MMYEAFHARVQVVGTVLSYQAKGLEVRYLIEVSDDGNEWSVERSYEEFEALHKACKRAKDMRGRPHVLPRLPGTGWLVCPLRPQRSKQAIEAKRMHLDAYFEALWELAREEPGVLASLVAGFVSPAADVCQWGGGGWKRTVWEAPGALKKGTAKEHGMFFPRLPWAKQDYDSKSGRSFFVACVPGEASEALRLRWREFGLFCKWFSDHTVTVPTAKQTFRFLLAIRSAHHSRPISRRSSSEGTRCSQDSFQSPVISPATSVEYKVASPISRQSSLSSQTSLSLLSSSTDTNPSPAVAYESISIHVSPPPDSLTGSFFAPSRRGDLLHLAKQQRAAAPRSPPSAMPLGARTSPPARCLVHAVARGSQYPDEFARSFVDRRAPQNPLNSSLFS